MAEKREMVSIEVPKEWAAAVKKFIADVDGAKPAIRGGRAVDYAAFERLSLETSAAQMRQAQADKPLRRMPVVVLSYSRDLPNPFGFPSDWPLAGLERAFQQSQDMLADLVPGARHRIAARSGHYIQLDQPRLVTRAIRAVVRDQRVAGRS